MSTAAEEAWWAAVAAAGGARMLAGIRNVQFAARSADISFGAFAPHTQVLSDSITPGSTDAIIGMLLSVSSSGPSLYGRLMRGSTALIQEIALNTGYRRQLFVDKPNTIDATTYSYTARNASSATRTLYQASSMTLFEFSDTVKAGIRTTDLAVNANTWTTVASVSITPDSVDTLVRLQFLVLNPAARTARILRGSTVLATTPNNQGTLDVDTALETGWPNNWEDWVDAPASTSEQTYHLQQMGAVSTAYKGSYILAEPVSAS